MSRCNTILNAFVFLVGTASFAAAQDSVAVTGCASKGVEMGCWVLKGTDGKSYSFAGRTVTENKCYAVTGTPTFGFCMQGTQLAISKIDASADDCCGQASSGPACVDFASEAGTKPGNPLAKAGATLTTFDFQLNQAKENSVDERGLLAVNRKLVIDLPADASAFGAGILVASSPTTWTAFDAGGKQVDTNVFQQGARPHTAQVLLIGPKIRKVVAETRNNEGGLHTFCSRQVR